MGCGTSSSKVRRSDFFSSNHVQRLLETHTLIPSPLLGSCGLYIYPRFGDLPLFSYDDKWMWIWSIRRVTSRRFSSRHVVSLIVTSRRVTPCHVMSRCVGWYVNQHQEAENLHAGKVTAYLEHCLDFSPQPPKSIDLRPTNPYPVVCVDFHGKRNFLFPRPQWEWESYSWTQLFFPRE